MKTATLIFFIILNSFGVNAQFSEPQSPEQRTSGKVGHLKSLLSLTEPQTKSVNQIYLNHFKSVDSLRNVIAKREPNRKILIPALLNMFRAKQLETDNEISVILNKDQKLVFEKYAIARRNSTRVVEVKTVVKPKLPR